VDAIVDRNVALIDRLDKGQLDLAVLIGAKPRADSEVLATLPMAWVGSPRSAEQDVKPLPLAVFEAPCFFRAAATDALDKAGIPWRIAFTSPSLSGLWAATDAGLGITVRIAGSVPDRLVVLDKGVGLPKLPSVSLSLSSGGRSLSPAAARLREVLLETLPVKLRPATDVIPLRAARA
jgi:DNA-binding transcriptional LysR family regulator